MLHCPYPGVVQVSLEKVVNEMEGSQHCDYLFTWVYDLQRHVLAVHGIDVEKETMDRWAQRESY